MSGIAVVFDPSGAPVDAGALGRILQGLEHRGPDGCAHVTTNGVAIGHRHFWTTPEEVGEGQPVRSDDRRLLLALDGRIDNREELASQLAISSHLLASLSDARLLLRAFDRWGARLVEKLVGEFALVVHDARNGELTLARDPMGERSLFYRREGDVLLVASEPAVIARPGKELDSDALAHYFAFEIPPDGRSLYRDVRAVLPGEVISVDATAMRRRIYWEPDFERRLVGLRDEEYAERFLALLTESVRCRLRASHPLAVQMSGGLDSGSVAGIAARLMAPAPLTTISWVFDELAECDEREYIDAISAKWGTRALQVRGDDAWPLRDLQQWPQTPNHPELNVYRLLKLGIYNKAASEGIRTLLTGCYSDELYERSPDWLAELLLDGRFSDAAAGCAAYARKHGLARLLGSGTVRRVVPRTLLGRRVSRRVSSGSLSRPWLARGANRTGENDSSVGRSASGIEAIVSRLRAHESTGHLGCSGIELRHPFRDRRLVEFVLALPAHQMFNDGLRKHVLRRAMAGLLPEPVLARITSSPLTALCRRGFSREAATIQKLLDRPGATWREFVDSEWIEESRKHWASGDGGGVELLVPWACAAFELWKQTYDLAIMPPGARDAAN